MHYEFYYYLREAGFEPANPKDVGLSDAALTTNRFARNIIGCSLRDSNPRPWAHKTQILPTKLKEQEGPFGPHIFMAHIV